MHEDKGMKRERTHYQREGSQGWHALGEKKGRFEKVLLFTSLSLDFRVTDDNNDDDDVGMEDGGLADDENREEK